MAHWDKHTEVKLRRQQVSDARKAVEKAKDIDSFISTRDLLSLAIYRLETAEIRLKSSFSIRSKRTDNVLI
jgi:hypothetical protein